MRSGSQAQLIYTLVLLGTGLALGWWLADKSPNHAPADPEPQLQQAPDTRPKRQTHAPGSVSQTESGGDPVPGPQAKSENHGAERFLTLLEQQSFEAAMDLYQRVEDRNPEAAHRLKDLVLKVLEDYLQDDRDRALTRVVEAFVGRECDEIDVLLVLARHQRQSGYFMEALQSFQLAHNYALAQPDKQPLLEEALGRFVERTDRHLASDKDWQSLLHFYERLERLELAQPEHRLRRAQLHLQKGDRDRGRRLLRRLAQEPELAARASALLERSQGSPPVRTESTPRDSIALERAGGHFSLPVRFNGGRDMRLIIDTGASLTALSSESFSRLTPDDRLTHLGSQLFNTAGGPVRGEVYRVERVRLGRHQLSNVRLAVLDFELPDRLDGLLGRNFLRHFRCELDQERQRLLLQPKP